MTVNACVGQMKKSSKAALLSGLIFPGIGHIVLKEHRRGFILIVLSAVALFVLFTSAYHHAQLIVEQIVNGEVPMEAGAIAQAVSTSTNAADSLAENSAVIVLVACWLAGVLDSYRLGVRQEKSDM